MSDHHHPHRRRLKARLASACRAIRQTPTPSSSTRSPGADGEQAELDDDFNRRRGRNVGQTLADRQDSGAGDDAKAYLEARARGAPCAEPADAASWRDEGNVMARIELALRSSKTSIALETLTRFDASPPPTGIGEIVRHCRVLSASPLIGRPVQGSRRELLIGRGRARAMWDAVPLRRKTSTWFFVLAITCQARRRLRALSPLTSRAA